MLYVLLMLLVVTVDSITLKQFTMCMHGMHGMHVQRCCLSQT